jgi:hypothetical protein
MLGDFLYNLRSALDHVVVASVPRRRRYRAFYPIVDRDLWGKDTEGRYVIYDNEARERFDDAVEGIDPLVKSFIQVLQPYVADQIPDLADPSGETTYGPARHVLSHISRLENADKHRELVNIATGVQATLFARIRYDVISESQRIGQFIPDGAQVLRFNQTDPSLQESEVYVNVNGPALVKIKIPDIGADGRPMIFDLMSTIHDRLKLTL